MGRIARVVALLGASSLVIMAGALAVGGAGLSPAASWRALVDAEAPGHAIVLALRAPRVVSGFSVGALLGLGGALLQLLLRNPLAEPYVLGLSGGAALGALLALALALEAVWVGIAGALGAALSLAALLALSAREFRRHADDGASERLLLSGVMLAALWGALITLLLSVSSEGTMRELIFWLMGDLAGGGYAPFLEVALVVVLVLAMLEAPRLNVLLRGDDVAFALGVRVGALRLRIVVLAALAAGAAVSYAGTVGFVGLVAPHLVRIAWGNDQRLLLPASALVGGAFVVIADTLARVILAPQQLPVGALTAILGAPVFLFLLWHSQR